MSLEPSASNVSARSLDLNSTAAAQQEEHESFVESIKNCDLDSRDELSGVLLEEDKSVREAEENQGFRDDIHVVAKSLGFSDESLKEGDEAPNPISPNPTDPILECNNELEIKAALPEVEEGGLSDSKHLSVDSLVREDNFANNGSSGEAGEATEYIPVVKTQALKEYPDDKQFQSNEDQECKSGFTFCDMVWGKVRSHPWWPGQIYHPSFSSEMALKHKKEDCFLIAYFGDNSFAWNDESQLKPFESCFSQMEKQSNLKAFVDAVDESLEEVARRIEIGMTCACIDDELIVDLKHRVFENAGIKKGTCCPTLDQCFYASSFDPGWLLNYIQDLAQFPCGQSEKLELVKVKALLMAIYRSRGYTELPEFRSDDGILDNKNVVSTPEKEETEKDDIEYKEDEIFLDDTSLKEKRRGRGRPPGKKKQIEEEGRKQKSLPELMKQTDGNIVEDRMPSVKSKQIGEDGKKVKSLPELMRQTADYATLNGNEVKGGMICALMSSRKKREIGASDSFDYGKSKKKRLNSLGDIENVPASRMRAVKIGQRISQVANKMKFSQNHKKFRKEKTNEYKRSKTPTRVATSVQDYPAPGVMLSQLCLAAQGSTKAYRVESAVIDFFVGWRDSQVSESLEDEKLLNLTGSRNGLKKLAEFDIAPVETKSGYIQDSYWSDVIFEESPKKERPSRVRKRKRKKKSKSKISQAKKKKVVGRSLLSDSLEPTVNISKPISDCPASLKDKQQQDERQVNLLDNKAVEECNPAALILNFSDANALPSESNLITVFSQYGPLKEADTEVSRKSRRASVVFKRGADAEVAFSSAGKFNAFGPALVSYRLRYSASSSPDTTPMKNPSPADG